MFLDFHELKKYPCTQKISSLALKLTILGLKNFMGKMLILGTPFQPLCTVRSSAKRGRTKFQAMDEIHEHKVFIKCLLTLFFNRFSKNYTLRLIVFKSREIFSLKTIPLGISQTDLKIIMFIEFMYCMKFRLSSFCSSYINKEYTVR